MINRFAAETYQGRPCPHCGGTERYRSNSACINARQHPRPRRQRHRGQIAIERARLRKQEFLR